MACLEFLDQFLLMLEFTIIIIIFEMIFRKYSFNWSIIIKRDLKQFHVLILVEEIFRC